MTNEKLNRRKMDQDNSGIQINDMITSENSPKDRAVLLVLQQINATAQGTKEAVKEICDDFRGHIKDYSEHKEADKLLLATGRGMWKVTAWVLGIGQVGVLAVAGFAWNELVSTTATIRRHDMEIYIMKQQVENLQKANRP